MKLLTQNIQKSAAPLKLCDDFQNYIKYLRMKGLKDHTIGEHKRFLFGALSHSEIANKKIQDLKLTDVTSVIEAGSRKMYGVLIIRRRKPSRSFRILQGEAVRISPAP
jgi:hypothetical protein